jgi:hypothetical protein
MSDIKIQRVPRRPYLSKKFSDNPEKVKEYQKQCSTYPQKLANYHTWIAQNQDLIEQRNAYSKFLFERR